MKEKMYSSEELIPIVMELAAEWGGMEHSSITYEKAQELMEAVLYCIGQLEGASAPGQMQVMTDKLNAKEAYLLGRQITADKVHELRELYNDLIPDFKDYGVACLGDVVKKGIPEFLLHYDIRYAPQETIPTLDYPVLRDMTGQTGINAVLEYVKCICLEQQFLQRFDEAYVCAVLRDHCRDYEFLAENICTIVRQSVLDD